MTAPAVFVMAGAAGPMERVPVPEKPAAGAAQAR
jgi:hypothetical protein